MRCLPFGLRDDEGVYIVPLNFGFKYENGELELYFHGHVKGKKMTLIEQQEIVGFEMDRKHELITAEVACDYSYLYQSIIGKGRISVLTDLTEKTKALQHMMKKYTQKDDWEFKYDLNRVAVFKVNVTEWACKEH